MVLTLYHVVVEWGWCCSLTSGVKQGHAALLSMRNNVPVWGTRLCCVVQKWRQKVSFLMVHAWRDQERELLQAFLMSVSKNSSWELNSCTHVLFQVKSLFLLPLIAQSDNVTLNHSILYWVQWFKTQHKGSSYFITWTMWFAGFRTGLGVWRVLWNGKQAWIGPVWLKYLKKCSSSLSLILRILSIILWIMQKYYILITSSNLWDS